MSDQTYLFIDGAYLRERHREAMLSVFGVDGDLELSPTKSRAGASRVYFYDCIDDALGPGETEEARQARVGPLEKLFSEVQSLSAFHVRPGTVKRGRKRERNQKEVDVSLTVDMMTHGFNGTMSKAVLLASDLDFRPVVEALVRQRVFVEIWYHRSSVADELLTAADFGREIKFRQLYEWNSQAFKDAHRVPRHFEQNIRPSSESLKVGSVGRRRAELYKWQSQFQLWIYKTGSHESIVISDEDLDLIERYVAAQYVRVKWQANADEIIES